MTTQGKFWQCAYGWGLLPGLVLLWLLTFNSGYSLAQTPTPTATPVLLPRQSADIARARVDAQTAAAAAAAQLQARSDGTLWVDYNPTTGAARWVATEGTALTQEFAGRNLSPEASARAFLGAYGRLFGVADQAAELQLTQIKGDPQESQHVTFQQQQAGIKVFGADLKVHLDGTGAVKLINGYTLPTARGLSLTPTLSPDQAAQTAVATTGLADGVVISNTLVILNPGLITDQASPTYLTYQVRVDSAAQPDAAVWLFIDAATGEVRFSYPAVTDARNRNTYNLQHGTNLAAAALARNETGAAVTSAPNCSVNDINLAHDYAGQAYDFYFNRFGRDSYDGAGAAMNSYVCYGVGYRNAMWTGSKMVYGDGYVLDDVVGHELSHAVTQYISGLIYSGQSGALNESFSDIMGEALDLTNNSANDAATVRWDMGEELLNIGAIRDMMDPTRFRNPDRTDSPYFDCANQAVHTNSGVQNKAFALMVDGGVFNNYYIDPVGLDKAVATIYRANDLYLTSSAKFLDAYNAINRSCNELYGAGSADCTNVKKALDATRMSGSVCNVGGVAQPTPPPTPTPTNTPTATPTPTPTPTNVRAVAAWGYNGTGASSVPTGMQAIAVVGGIYHSLALKVDGTVAAWGCTGTIFGQCNVPAGLSGVKTIAAGTGHSLAVKADGKVVAWGCSGFGYGQCTPPVGLTGVISVAGGYVHSLALKSDGTVVAWGCSSGSWSAYGQCNVPTGLSGVKAIAAGYQHNLALKNDGTVVAWGRNTSGQSNVPAGLSGVVAISAGESHSLALKSDGTVVSWGCLGGTNYNFGQCTIPAGLTDVVAIGAGHYHSLVLKRDGTVVAWGCVGGTNYNLGQCTIPAGLSGVTAISAGGAHNLVLTWIAPTGGGAGGAVVAADTSATPLTDTMPLTLPMLGEAFLPITPSLPVSAPVLVDAPPVTTTQPVTTGDTGTTPVDANAPDASQQNQRLFLPLITNLAGAALGSPGAVAGVVVVVIVVGGLVWRSRRSRRHR
jgi:Zn-dependent metalloprotease/alpha-tubulin suppressor-like RCC1 family protein